MVQVVHKVFTELAYVILLMVLKTYLEFLELEFEYNINNRKWASEVLTNIIFINLGFSAFKVATISDQQGSDAYVCKTLLFSVFQLIFVVMLIINFIQSFHINDAVKQQPVESQILGITVGILHAWTGVLSFLMILPISFLVYVACVSHFGRRQRDMSNRQHYRDIMATINHFPYGSIVDAGSITECPICLEEFTEASSVVQLKCSKYHVFHEQCIRNLLEYSPESEHKCPYCRQRIAI